MLEVFALSLSLYIYIYIYISPSSPCRAISTDIPDTLSPRPPYRPLLLAGLRGYTLYWNRAVVCRFGLVVLLLLVHVKEYTEVHHL